VTYTGKVTVGGPPELRDLPGLSAKGRHDCRAGRTEVRRRRWGPLLAGPARRDGGRSGLATTPRPRPAEVIEKLGLWKRVPPAEQNGTPS
jgi:hypothetical protein